ncbi:MAG TPA: zinc ribbon domain-containing protein, partial [Pyrinomonadaceae bacterium]|nr:zinc ribbon domain-containing protein [Pyrinomonadaceae bacterium]
MFCPQCGSTQSDDLKYCKTCGANLNALRQVMASRDTGEKFDWSKTWVAEMFQSGDIATRRAAEIDLMMGRTPEEKRLIEIKAGVITASVGVGVTVLLFVLMGGIIASGRVTDAAAEILSRLW